MLPPILKEGGKMEKTAFEQTARKVQELLEGRVIVDNTKEEVMDFLQQIHAADRAG